MRKMALPAVAILLATIPLAASAQPVSNYSVRATWEGGQVTVGWGETVATSVDVVLDCPADPYSTEVFTSRSVTAGTFSNIRHQSVSGSVSVTGNHVACDGTVTADVPFTVDFSGSATGHTDRVRTAARNRVLTTPMSFAVTSPVLPASQGAAGSFVEVIS